MTFTPSTEQSNIFREMLSSNLIVSACPGSGKSTTIFHAFKHIPLGTGFIPPRILYIVFAKRNQLEAVERCRALGITGIEITTGHSLGLRALKASGLISDKAIRSRDFVDARKVPKLVWKAMSRDNPDIQGVIKLVSLAKGHVRNGGATHWAMLQEQYDISFDNPSKAQQIAQDVLAQSTKDLTCIDFDDMLYLPVVLNVPFAPADWVFVDECQDTNEVQNEIIFRLAKPKQVPVLLNTPYQMFSSTRYVFVGDPHQAIYGFRGAQCDAMERLKTRFGCQELPLSVSFRCPKAVVKEAQKYI